MDTNASVLSYELDKYTKDDLNKAWHEQSEAQKAEISELRHITHKGKRRGVSRPLDPLVMY